MKNLLIAAAIGSIATGTIYHELFNNNVNQEDEVIVEKYNKPKFLLKVDNSEYKDASIIIEKYKPEVLDLLGFKKEIKINYDSLQDYYNNNQEGYFTIQEQNKYINSTDIVGYDVEAFRVEFLINKDKYCTSYIESILTYDNVNNIKVSYKTNEIETLLFEAINLTESKVNEVCESNDIKLIQELNVKKNQ
jgi:hypothetical protein